ncbi:unnamed protein product [Caenorhabditis bovis]|uniref:G-protein coupled receptors family 1 profile domain-containing protein n=1 Tax=Caenorhabditis bovis TaxID=2654633 RepID=A0A8S1DZR9_9PELO|nr:unnamed protein product [Caenorhabditis bovis]
MDILRRLAFICSPFVGDSYMNTGDCIFVIVLTILVIIGISLNLALLYMIVFKSPPTLTPYRIFLANTTISQLLLSITSFIGQPRVLATPTHTIVIYLGPVQYLGEWLSYMVYLSSLHFSLNSFISLMLSMIYRYNSVKHRKFSSPQCYCICLAGYSYCLILLLSCAQIEVSRDEIINEPIVGNIVPDYRQYNMINLLIFISLITIGLIPIYVVMYWCRFRINKILMISTNIYNSTTKANAQRLVTALTIQSIFPIASVFPSVFLYGLSQAKIIETGLYSYFIVPCITICTIVDPVVTAICVIPYRRFILKIC